MAPIVTMRYKAVAIDAGSGCLDLGLYVEKTIHWIKEAGKYGCKIIALPELCSFVEHP
jgi:hypothetical protein